MSHLACSTTYETTLGLVLRRGTLQDNSILTGTSFFRRGGEVLTVRIIVFRRAYRLTQGTRMFWEPEL
jgi:hypothetical protein